MGWSYGASTAVESPTVHAYNKRLTGESTDKSDGTSFTEEEFDGDSLRDTEGEDLEQSREGTRHLGE